MQKEDIGSAWNLAADLGNGRQLSVMFNMANGASKEEMNSEVDKLLAVLNRQQAKSALIAVEQEIEREELRHSETIKDLADLDVKYTAKTPNSQEKQQREIAVKTIANMKTNIDYKRGVLQKLKQEAS